jgi:hypothetical protein
LPIALLVASGTMKVMANGNSYKKTTEFAATRTLEGFFAKKSDSDFVTKDEIFAAWGRDRPEYEKTNEGWLSNRLTGIYYYDLAKPVYSFHPWRKLERLELTIKGKRALGRVSQPVTITPIRSPDPPEPQTIAGNGAMTYQDLAKAIAAFRNENPDFEVVFKIALKEVSSTK